MVLKRHWVEDRIFLAAMALAQIMPGANRVKLSVLIGQHLRGAAGAVVAVFGLLAGPFAIILLIGGVYAGVSGSTLLHAMLDGVAPQPQVTRRRTSAAWSSATSSSSDRVEWPTV